MTLDGIIERIKSANGVSDFKITECVEHSYQLFFVHGKLETVRCCESEETQISVYVDHDGKRGNASFSLSGNMSEEALDKKLKQAIDNALMIFDEPYSLPSDETSDVCIESNLSSLEPKEAAARAAKAVLEANVYDDCDINALEVFVTKHILHIVNSRGVDKRQTKHSLSLEAIPTCNGESESVELFETYTLAELDEEWIKKEISARIEDVRARLVAKKPTQKIDCPVILNAYELKELFETLVADCNFATHYSNTNLFNVGDAMQSAPKGDRLNISMKPLVKGSPASSNFDGDGCGLVGRQIVKDGKVAAGFGSFRFAQYLGEIPTGVLPCIDVGAGETEIKDMLAKPHLELVYLSGLQVDLLSDYIGGEIRLAYYFDGERRVPVTGVAMSGKLSEALNTLTLSKERAVLGDYSGPAKISLEGMNIF